MQRAIDRLEPFQRAISKAHLAAAGVSVDALEKKPLIAIANSWNEICPGHEPLKKLAEEVKKGILEAGGEPGLRRDIQGCVTVCPTERLLQIPLKQW